MSINVICLSSQSGSAQAFTGCMAAFAAAQEDAEHIQRHEAGEIPATLPTKNAGTMAPAFFFVYGIDCPLILTGTFE